MINAIDVKMKLVNPMISILKVLCTTSVIDYVESLLQDTVTAFIIFAVILTFSMLGLMLGGFRNIKRNMINTNIVLRMIPFDTLDKTDVHEIKKFFTQ
jgi:ABC-type nitrate/sulfonate/bicarbonate transport system permease component